MAIADGHIFCLNSGSIYNETEIPLWRLATYLNISISQINKLIQEDKFPKPIKCRGIKRWVVEDIFDWEQQQAKESSEDKAAKYLDF